MPCRRGDKAQGESEASRRLLAGAFRPYRHGLFQGVWAPLSLEKSRPEEPIEYGANIFNLGSNDHLGSVFGKRIGAGSPHAVGRLWHDPRRWAADG